MKKIVFCAFFLLSTLGSVHAADTNMAELLAAVKHAHPLPNLMRVIVKNQDKLALSKEQKQGVTAWIKEHRPIVAKLAMSIKEGEKALHEAALNCATKEEMMAKLDELLKKRREIAEIKMDCRDSMRKLLGYDKWQKFLKLYKDM